MSSHGSQISVHTLFDDEKPLITAFCGPTGKTSTFTLYHSGSGLSVHEIEKNKRKIQQLICKSLVRGHKIILSGFKSHIAAFDIKITSADNVFDQVLPDKLLLPESSLKKSEAKAATVSQWLTDRSPKKWQCLFANAGIVYQDLENRGVFVGDILQHPHWSQNVFSGRSKTTGFNIQGATNDFVIRNPAADIGDVFIHFDWKAADIRIAALLSGDEKLLEISYHDDPYIAVSEGLGINKRSDAKVELLRSINSMNIDSPAVRLFPELQGWIRNCRGEIHEKGVLDSILGRRFRIVDVSKKKQKKKNPALAVFNATMQGSIAHAMHNCLKRVWDEVDDRLVCEMHDSIVVTCPNDKKHVKRTIRNITEIAKNPFYGLLDTNPVFPVAVSVGSQWRKWKKLRVFS